MQRLNSEKLVVRSEKLGKELSYFSLLTSTFSLLTQMRFLSAAAFAASLLFAVGCSGDIPALRLSMNRITVDPSTLKATFNVDTNTDWRLSFDDPAASEWRSATPLSGKGFKVTTVTVTAQQNPDTVRTTTLTVTAGRVSAQVKVEQGLGFVAYFANPVSGRFTVNETAGTGMKPDAFNITLTTPYPVNNLRKVTLGVSSPDGTKGVLYDYASPEVLFAAMDTTATFTVQGLYEGFGDLPEATLNVKITDSGDFVPVRFNQTYTLTMERGKPE